MKKNADRSLEGFDPGELVFSWKTFDYHPNRHGIVWILLFCSIFFGTAVWALWYGDWIMAFTLFLAVAVYFYIHRQGNEEQEIRVFDRAIIIDRMILPFEKIIGYWILYDETASIVNLEIREKYRTRNIALQMGDKSPGFFRKYFKIAQIPELEDRKESLVDLWIRALKL
ncbi:hypothetical protein K9M59_03885 [Candidatus Gracilibacteria bacterium]|nr:hypothetical protein [Candidatus Gracilibacteria bacterium]MCF7819464.1 hypothetical protein [Candidatus Gracilibacteria bacterium]